MVRVALQDGVQLQIAASCGRMQLPCVPFIRHMALVPAPDLVVLSTAR